MHSAEPDRNHDQRSEDSALEQLAGIVLGAQPLGAVLGIIAEVAADVLPEVDEVSITLVERGRARSVAFSGLRAAALDERQYRDGYGPCLDAAVTGDVVTVENTIASTAYPAFGRQAARAGISNVYSVGLASVTGGTGSLNLYCTGGPLSPRARDLAERLGSFAAVALANAAVAAVHAGEPDEIGRVRTATASRAMIEQAKGIVMGEFRCTADEAFDLLRERSSRLRRKLPDLAQELVDMTADRSR